MLVLCPEAMAMVPSDTQNNRVTAVALERQKRLISGDGFMNPYCKTGAHARPFGTPARSPTNLASGILPCRQGSTSATSYAYHRHEESKLDDSNPERFPNRLKIRIETRKLRDGRRDVGTRKGSERLLEQELGGDANWIVLKRFQTATLPQGASKYHASSGD